jgi:hypothetical protein
MKELFGEILMLVGLIVNIVGSVKFLVAAKRVSTGWFIGCLFCIVWPFFCLTHFSEARKPLLIWFIGFLIAGFGTMMVQH